MTDAHYLFIDGGYLRARHSEALKGVFGEPGALELSNVRKLHPIGAFQRVFYYDCLHDIPKVNETEAELKTRIEAQQAFFDKVQSLEGFHVRLGSLSGNSRKFRQKEVDILLAVDVLDHAFRKNMVSVTLLAGDLDFAPLVEALVRLGTWVEIWYDGNSVGKHLLDVGDKRQMLGFHDYYNLAHLDFQQAHPLPQQYVNATLAAADRKKLRRLKSGTFQNQGIDLYERENDHVLWIPRERRLLSHSDPVVLENYFSLTQSKITWK